MLTGYFLNLSQHVFNQSMGNHCCSLDIFGYGSTLNVQHSGNGPSIREPEARALVRKRRDLGTQAWGLYSMAVNVPRGILSTYYEIYKLQKKTLVGLRNYDYLSSCKLLLLTSAWLFVVINCRQIMFRVRPNLNVSRTHLVGVQGFERRQRGGPGRAFTLILVLLNFLQAPGLTRWSVPVDARSKTWHQNKHND